MSETNKIINFIRSNILRDVEDEEDLLIMLKNRIYGVSIIDTVEKYNKLIFTPRYNKQLLKLQKRDKIDYIDEFKKIRAFVRGFNELRRRDIPDQSKLKPIERRFTRPVQSKFNVDDYVSNVIKKVARKSADKKLELERMISYGKSQEKRDKRISKSARSLPSKLEKKSKPKKEKKAKVKKEKKTYIRKTDKQSPWIEHVKKYQKEHGVSYREAIKKAKASYTVQEKERQRTVNTRQSPWITHVKKYQKEHGVSYKEAIKKAKASYVAPPPLKVKREYKQPSKSDRVQIYNLTNWNTHLKNIGKEYAPNTWFKSRDSMDTIRQKLYTYASRLKGYLHRAKRGFKVRDLNVQKESKALYDKYIDTYNKIVKWVKEGLVKNKSGKIRGWIVVNEKTEEPVSDTKTESKTETKTETKTKTKPKPKKPKPKPKTEFKTEWIDNMNRNYEGKLNLKEEDIKDIKQHGDDIMIILKYNIDISMYDADDEEYVDDMIDGIYLEKQDMGYNVELRQNIKNRQGDIESVSVDEFFIYT